MVKLLHLSSSIKNGCKVSETILNWQGTAPTGRGTGQLSQGTRGVQGGKSPSEQNPRAIVVYPVRLCSPLVDILPRRSRFLIPSCRFGIIHTFCSFASALYDYSLLAIPPWPRPLM